jgi:hypothetical protein
MVGNQGRNKFVISTEAKRGGEIRGSAKPVKAAPDTVLS